MTDLITRIEAPPPHALSIGHNDCVHLSIIVYPLSLRGCAIEDCRELARD
ncbi:MAG: hypothetical protein WCN98_02375 [Verrucomicrobiaceae bacterium]